MADIALPLVPFVVPREAVVQMPPGKRGSGLNLEFPTVPLHTLPRATVEQLCAEFTQSVMSRYDLDVLAARKKAESDRTER